jgi:hypothetical protein
MARAAYGLPDRNLHSGRWIALTAAMAVLVMAAAAVTLAMANSPARDGSPQAGARARQSGPPAGPSPTVPGGTRAAALASGNIAVAAGVAASPYERLVVSFLTRYFAAINDHDYRAYLRLFGRTNRDSLTAAAFSAGYGSTRDSLATLRHIGVISQGHLAAIITFTSHQKPGQSPSQSACTRWRISVYLTREGNEYLLQMPPSGYQASFRACP